MNEILDFDFTKDFENMELLITMKIANYYE